MGRPLPVTSYNAVRRLVSDANVKRSKYKTNTDGLVKKWWFVIHLCGDEKIMYLEREWGKIKIQTGWSLEPVYIYTTIC